MYKASHVFTGLGITSGKLGLFGGVECMLRAVFAEGTMALVGWWEGDKAMQALRPHKGAGGVARVSGVVYVPVEAYLAAMAKSARETDHGVLPAGGVYAIGEKRYVAMEVNVANELQPIAG